jgi:hypothetical protein
VDSWFQSLLSNSTLRRYSVVRNPVEVLISGFLYHRRRPTDEQWWGGLCVQQPVKNCECIFKPPFLN